MAEESARKELAGLIEFDQLPADYSDNLIRKNYEVSLELEEASTLANARCKGYHFIIQSIYEHLYSV